MARCQQILLGGILLLCVALPVVVAQERKHGPLTEGAIINLLQGGVAPQRVAALAQQYGVTFPMTPAVESDLRTAGADDALIQTLREIAPKPSFPRPAPQEPPTPRPAKPAVGQMWHSVGTLYDFRVTITSDLFHAERVHIPPEEAQQGAFIRTECRRRGSKWVGSTNAKMAFTVHKVRGGRETKFCQLTLQFEVDSVSPDKITGHSETPKKIDANKCRVSQMTWGDFTWVPIS